MAILEGNTENFDALIDAPYAVVDCYGDFCAACVMLEPVYTAAANDMGFIRFIRVNISQYGKVAERFGINAMPTLLYFRSGELVTQSVGSIDREELNKYLAEMLYQ